MKVVGLLRHAKSSRDDSRLRDFDRPLNHRGIRASELMGAELRRRQVSFDLVLASPARRVVETIENFESGYREQLRPHFDLGLYESSAAILLNKLSAVEDIAQRVLLVGHNPSLQDLAKMLVAADDVRRSELLNAFPTAAAALIEIPVLHWRDVKLGTGRISWLIKPRDLESTEGTAAH